MCFRVVCAGGRKSSQVAAYVSLSTMDESCLRGRGAPGVNGSPEEKEKLDR